MSSAIKSMRVGKVEKPRPLKSASTSSIVGKGVEDVLADLEKVCRMISSETFNAATASAITSLSYHLKMMGHQLEGICKDELDKRFVQLRNGCRDERLDRASRVRLLELVELRAQQTPWSCNENVAAYYRQMLQLIESQQCAGVAAGSLGREVAPAAGGGGGGGGGGPLLGGGGGGGLLLAEPPQLPPLLTPGEVIRGSGKYPKPTKIQGKYKDEVVIRNCDSGKVMGMKGIRVHKIEEMSQTVISFQRVAAGAKERLVQITGPGEDNVLRARELIEEVIRRNASPARDERGSAYSLTAGEGSTGSLNSAHSDDNIDRRRNGSGDFGTLGEFKYTVFVGEHSIKLTSKNVDLVKTAKLVLDEYFNSALPVDLDACMMEDQLTDGEVVVTGGGDGRACDCASPSELIRAEASVVSVPTDRDPVVVLKPPASVGAAPGTGPEADGAGTTAANSAVPVNTSQPPPAPQQQQQGYTQQDRRSTFSRRLVIPASAEVDVGTAVAAAVAAGAERAAAAGRPVRQYTRDELLMYSKSAVARYPPRGWPEVRQRHPVITRAAAKVFDADDFTARPAIAPACRQTSTESGSRSPTPP